MMKILNFFGNTLNFKFSKKTSSHLYFLIAFMIFSALSFSVLAMEVAMEIDSLNNKKALQRSFSQGNQLYSNNLGAFNPLLPKTIRHIFSFLPLKPLLILGGHVCKDLRIITKTLWEEGMILSLPREDLDSLYDLSSWEEHRYFHVCMRAFDCLSAPPFHLFTNNYPFFCQLKSLYIGYDNLGTEGIKDLFQALEGSTALRTLYLKGNKIGVQGALHFQQWLQTHPILTTLILNQNNMEDFHTQENGTEYIAQSLQNQPHLEILAIKYNRLGNAGIEALAQSLLSNTTLTELHLGGSLTWGSVESLGRLAESLKKVPLKELNFGFNQLGEEETQSLLPCLHASTSLTSLIFNHNMLTSKGMQLLSQALSTILNLKTLDVSRNNFGNEGVKSLAESLTHTSSLTSLNVGETGFTDEGTQYLANLLQGHPALTLLNLRFNHIADKGASHIAHALKHTTTLSTLILRWCSIESGGAKDLSTALNDTPSLTILDLSDNHIGVEGTRYVASALKTTSTLRSLNLSNVVGYKKNQDGSWGRTYTRGKLLDEEICQQGLAFSRILADSLVQNTTLVNLSLRDNVIKNEGALSIAKIIIRSAIKELDLSSNGIRTIGASYLATALGRTTSLKKLILYNNRFDTVRSQSFLFKPLASNTILEDLDLDLTGIKKEGVVELTKMLERNTTLTFLRLADNLLDDEDITKLLSAKRVSLELCFRSLSL